MQKKSTLTKKEISILIGLLLKLRWPVPYPIFIALCKSVPLIAIDLAVMPDPHHLLLTYRKDEFYDNWHIPGMVLRFNDRVLNRLKRVAKDELDIRISKIRFIGYYEYRDVRTRGIGLLFIARPIGMPCSGEYFHINRLPKKFLYSQMSGIKLLRNLG